jgi:hypothetical protein
MEAPGPGLVECGRADETGLGLVVYGRACGTGGGLWTVLYDGIGGEAV